MVDQSHCVGCSDLVAVLTLIALVVWNVANIKMILMRNLFIVSIYHIHTISQRKSELFALQDREIVQKRMNNCRVTCICRMDIYNADKFLKFSYAKTLLIINLWDIWTSRGGRG